MLFEDDKPIKRKAVTLKALPPIPDTGWRAPTDYPNLSSAWRIGLDVETYDPELVDAGPGWGRGRGHIVGASLSAIDYAGNTGKWYFPIRHEVNPEQNLDPTNTLAYLKHTLADKYQAKVGANISYDIGWLEEEGVKVEGELHDVQYAEAIIDNNARVGLDILAQKYLGEHKTSDLLRDWITEAYKPKKSEWRANIYRTPPSLAGPYGEDDALLPLRILPMQGPIIDAEELYRVYRLECDLIPMQLAMRRAGVYVNVEKARRLKYELEIEIADLYQLIRTEYEFDLESTDSRQIGKLLDKLGISYPRTKPSKTYPDGQASIEGEWLAALEHPIGDILHDIREREKICGTFLKSYILDKNILGYLYPQFHPLRGEANGTMLGRFASSHPNLQNIPTRTKLGKRVRECFEHDPGHAYWRKHDYSQLHYRILADQAVGPGADELRQSYIDDPDMDYHFKVYQGVAPLMGWNTDYATGPGGVLLPMDQQAEDIQDNRRPIKNTNFGLLYGQQEKSLAYKLGMSPENAKIFFKAYHEGAPYVKNTMDAIANEASAYGFVTTLLGRRIRFNLWEPRGYNKGRPTPLPYDLAIKHYGTFIQLAYLYRAVNYKIQGSEPDIMKQGMLDCWNSGVFDYTGVPRLTVHDELDWSVTEDSPAMDEAFTFIQRTMEASIRLRVPLKVDATRGANWGKAK